MPGTLQQHWLQRDCLTEFQPFVNNRFALHILGLSKYSTVFFLNTVDKSFKKLAPMSNMPSVPLRLDSLQLATGSTSFRVQPCAPDAPSLNSAAGRTKGVQKMLLRHKWSKGQHSRGTETAGKWHQ